MSNKRASTSKANTSKATDNSRRRFEFRFGKSKRDTLVYDRLGEMEPSTRSDLVKKLLYAHFTGKIELPDADKAKKIDPREKDAIGKLMGVNFKDLT